MRIGTRRLVALGATVALIAAACGSGSGVSGGGGETGWPYTGKLKDGSTFKLADRIAEKVRAKKEVNYVFSYQSPSIPLFSDQYKAGYETTLPAGQKVYPMKGTIIAPVSESGVDVNGQVAQIEALLNTDSIDCISIEPATSDGYTAITNRMMAAGIPVFTVGVTSNGNELTNFTQIPEKEGAQAATIVLKWMKDNNKDLKVFAVSGGDPTAFWAQGRMKSFRETIMAAIPDAKFVNTETNGLATTYDPAGTYDAYKAFIAGHPDLQFIENVDIGAEHANRAIKDAGMEGKIFTLGWNVSYGQLDGIDAGTQVVALDQKWSEQAGFGAGACAALFGSGTVLPNTQELFPVTKENSAQARKDLDAVLGK